MNAIARTLFCSVAFASLTCHAPVAKASTAYDGFEYGTSATLAGKNGGLNWTSAWQNTGAWLNTKTISAGLTYPNLMTSPGAAKTPPASVYELATFTRSFGNIASPNNELFVSFLLRPDAGFGSGGGIRFGQWPKYIFVGAAFGIYQYGVTVGEGEFGDFANKDVVEGETELIVLKLKVTPGVNTQCSMYLNPDPAKPQPTVPDATYTTSLVGALPTSLSIHNEGGFTTDEIRVGSSWAEVLPTPPVCVGDLNDDGAVDGADLGILLGFWGLPGGDLDGDQSTDGADLGLLLASWGACP